MVGHIAIDTTVILKSLVNKLQPLATALYYLRRRIVDVDDSDEIPDQAILIVEFVERLLEHDVEIIVSNA